MPIVLTTLDQIAPELLKSHRVAGFTVAAFDDGAMVGERAYGASARQIRTPLRPDSCFCVASLTKPFVARLILALVERGALELDRPLFDYVPLDVIEENPWWRELTARHALAHSSGLPYRAPAAGRPLTLRFRPGERFQYSSQGYNYLQMVAENVTRAPLSGLAREQLLDPLQMAHTGLCRNDLGDVHWAGTPPEAVARRFWAQGGLWSTAADYGRFVMSVLDADGISPALRDEMFRPQVDAGFGTAWGLGWGLQDADGDRQIFHFGFAGSYRNYVQASPATRSAVVVLTNGVQGMDLCRQVVESARGWQFPGEMIDDFFSRIPAMKSAS